MVVDVYYTCIYARHKCALSYLEGCVLCYIHIYYVGVGVPSCFFKLLSPKVPKTAINK